MKRNFAFDLGKVIFYTILVIYLFFFNDSENILLENILSWVLLIFLIYEIYAFYKTVTKSK